MEPVRFTFLSQEEVLNSGLTMADVIAIVTTVFREHGRKQVENPPKPGIHPLSNAFIHAMPGYLPGLKAAGMKWVSSFSSNYERGMPAVMGLLVLNDCEAGQPLALMDCRWITAARTGAVSAVAARYLARLESQVVAIVGAGVQGRFNLLALKEVLPQLEVARVFDSNPDALEGYIAEMGRGQTFRVEGCSSAEQAIREADVIVTATGRINEPIYKEAWVKPGALVLPVHHRGWENAMLQRADKFVSDDWAQLQNAHHEVGGFDGSLPDLYAELGEIVLGDRPGRENDQERIIDFNYGLAIEDVAVAQEVWKRARTKSLGTELTLMESDNLFPQASVDV